jgi:thioredoxin 1
MNDVENVIKVTDADFEQQVVNSDLPVLVDFWAPWCGPCQLVGPILEDVAKEYVNKAKVAKVNVDEEKGIAGAMGIRSIPTVVLFHGGEVKDVLVGARPKDDFIQSIDKVLES